jgi:hypothetical protein
MIVQILTENSVGKYKDCGSGSDNSPEAQQVAKLESVGLAARQTHVHLGSSNI